jgi:microtubule-associated protein-like 1/2
VVATGQAGGHEGRDSKPHIRVWNSVSLATLAVIGLGDFHRSISCLSFSKAVSYLLLSLNLIDLYVPLYLDML